jgi:hypothetical protein
MVKPIPGNGSGKFEVHGDDMGGWLRVHTDSREVPDNLAFYLSMALTDWFRNRPHLRMGTVVSVARDGTTVELHAWYTQGVFPESSFAK